MPEQSTHTSQCGLGPLVEDVMAHLQSPGQVGDDRNENLDCLKAALILSQSLDELLGTIARQANASGNTWAEIARAAGLHDAQAAHHRWAEGREKRLDSLRKRVGGRRTSMATPDVPGRSAKDAAHHLGCDVRTLPGKVRTGEIREIEVLLNSGNVRKRYFLPGDKIPA